MVMQEEGEAKGGRADDKALGGGVNRGDGVG